MTAATDWNDQFGISRHTVLNGTPNSKCPWALTTNRFELNRAVRRCFSTKRQPTACLLTAEQADRKRFPNQTEACCAWLEREISTAPAGARRSQLPLCCPNAQRRLAVMASQVAPIRNGRAWWDG
jgi:hypothetical protein